MNSIVLDKIVVNSNRVDYFFSINGNLQKYFKADNHMFLEFNYDLSDIPISILTIPFVSNVMPLIWITNSTLKIEELDYTFHECLKKVKAAYQHMYPNVKFKGVIVVDAIISNNYIPEREAACLFSGGLDALTTFIRIKDKNPYLITEYGWHEHELKKSEVWEADKQNAVSFAKTYGLENILIQSNYGTFIEAVNIDHDFKKRLGDTWWHGLHHSLAIISAAIPIAYKFKVGCIFIASSFYKGYKGPCASDPTVDNEIRFASGVVFHDAYELTRQDKVKVVVDYHSTNDKPVSIRVCFKNSENCCNCEKCLRTILGIIAEGKKPNNFNFNIRHDVSELAKQFLDENIKYFTLSKIDAWELIKERMKQNAEIILYKDLLDWFIDYDFALEHRKALFKYRTTKFFPIIKRRISTSLSRVFQKIQ